MPSFYESNVDDRSRYRYFTRLTGVTIANETRRWNRFSIFGELLRNKRFTASLRLYPNENVASGDAVCRRVVYDTLLTVSRTTFAKTKYEFFFCFLFFPSWWMDVWAPTSICLILPKGFPKDRSCLSVGIEAFVYPYVYDTCGRLDCKLSSSVPLIIPMFHSIRFCWNVWVVLFCFLSLYFHFVWSPCACEISKNLPRKIGLRVRNTCKNT